MRAVYMLMHQRKPEAAALAVRIAQSFAKVHIKVAAEPWLRAGMTREMLEHFMLLKPEDCQAIVSVGGDGTLLRANALAAEHELPVLGINEGRRGFLAEIEPDQMDRACELLARGEYTIDERMMLCATVGDRTMLALNDVVLSRGGYSRLIGIDAWVGQEQIGHFIADGVIIATPTGSTGYSLSAGGPLVCPEVSCMLITPICAHSLQHRPVVTSDKSVITIRLDDGHHGSISVDGRTPIPFSCGETLTVTRAARPGRFIRLNPKSFFSTVRFKLSEWSC